MHFLLIAFLLNWFIKNNFYNDYSTIKITNISMQNINNNKKINYSYKNINKTVNKYKAINNHKSIIKNKIKNKYKTAIKNENNAIIENKKIIIEWKNKLYNYRIIKKGKNFLLIDFDVEKDVVYRDNDNCCNEVRKEYIWNIDLLNKYSESWYYNWKNFYFLLKPYNYTKADTLIIFLHWNINFWTIENARLWFKDNNFWWNFNRLKNLCFLNNRFYASIDFQDFKINWINNIIQFLFFIKNRYKNIKQIIFIAWSSWWELLSEFLKHEEKNKILKKMNLNIIWLIFEWSIFRLDDNILNYLKNNNIKVYIVHWEKDKNISFNHMLNVFIELQKNNITSFFVLVKNWIHWTPIRMIDYYHAFNFIFK